MPSGLSTSILIETFFNGGPPLSFKRPRNRYLAYTTMMGIMTANLNNNLCRNILASAPCTTGACCGTKRPPPETPAFAPAKKRRLEDKLSSGMNALDAQRLRAEVIERL
jgi:hypothetical protein